MMEKKTTLRIPEVYGSIVEDIRLLNADQNNPNVTTLKQQVQIWRSLQKYGWTYPMLTNKDGLLVDGETRTEICKRHGEFFAPVLRSQVTDVDRRMLRQILNKLKGKHNSELDNEEYVRILQLGEKEDLSYMQKLRDINYSGKESKKTMDSSKTQGIISQPLYFIKSKSLKLIFSSASNR